ncbi:MAG: hypothetical protein WD557_16040 [Dehalococcoidia bacterium]
MRYPVWFGERRQLEAVWLPTCLSSQDIDQCAGRLRGWALVQGLAIAGSAFVAFGRDGDGRVWLPLREPTVPRPETGIGTGRLAGGVIAVVRDVLFERAIELAECFESQLAPGGYRSRPEYQGAFHAKGQLTLALHAAPARVPAELIFGAPRTAPLAP